MRNIGVWVVGLLLCATGSRAAAPKPVIDPRVSALQILVVKPEIVIESTDQELFHGYPVTDKLTLTDPDEIWTVVTALNNEIVPRQDSICLFQPERALVISYKEKKVDFAISYACGIIERWTGEDPETLSLQTVATGTSSQEILDDFINDVHR